MNKRYRFLEDDDGHAYLIHEGQEEEFHEWLAAGPYWEDFKGFDFSESRIGTPINNFTFTDPKEDE